MKKFSGISRTRWGALAALVVLGALGASVSQVRLPLFRGYWYPDTADALRTACEQYLNEAQLPMPVRGRVIACVSPNAGYPNSGLVMAHAFKALEAGQYDRVIVLTGAHSARFSGCSIPLVQYYATPLGLVDLDIATCRRLSMSSLVESRSVLYRLTRGGNDKRLAIHETEHGIEVVLPFLQTTLGNFELVPIVVGDLLDADGRIRESAIDSLVNLLKRIVDDRTLIVVSSNLTYYGERYGYTPFNENPAEGIEWLDKQALHYVLNRDRRGFLDYLEKTRNPIDGAAPLAILMTLLPERVEGYLLNYKTGAREMGEGGSSVSYAALVFADPAAPPNERREIKQVQPWEPADVSDISLYGPMAPVSGEDTAGRLSQNGEAAGGG